jgi:subtilisin family serine protease
MSISSRRTTFVILLVTLATFVAFAQSAPTQYVILSKSQGKGSTDFTSAVNAAGGTILSNLDRIGVVVATSSNPNFASTIRGLAAVQDVAEDPEVNFLPGEQAVQADVTPTQDGVNSEPFNGFLWNIRTIHADQTAAAGDRGHGARVVVLDAGMNMANPDLAANVNTALSQSFVPGEVIEPQCTVPCFNHGTHVAGIIAAGINGIGVQGVAPEAELVAVKVLRESGSGTFGWLISGLEYTASINADVANMSLGAVFDVKHAGAGTLLAALNRAINHATAAGVLCVSAAGNNGVNLDNRLVSIPAQSGNGIAISATGPVHQANFDHFAHYSNYGQSVVNLAAPGGEFGLTGSVTQDLVLSTSKWPFYFFAAGTSMATPHVSGVAALIVGKYGHIGPARIQAIMQQTAVDLYKPGADPFSGNGRVDAANALK